jgi:DNA-binding LacI/PurR family transcriptional regulator
VKQPTYEVGQTAAHLLIQQIDQPARPPSKVVLATTLNVAKSSVRGSSVAKLAAVMAKGQS